jgi:hypothetical protein
MDAALETKKANNYALNPKNKDDLESKWWQHITKATRSVLSNCITCKMVPRAAHTWG